MRVEGGDGNAGERPDIVEIDLAGQHVHQSLVGLGRDHGDDMLALVGCGRAEARAPVSGSRLMPKASCLAGIAVTPG